MTSSIYLLWLAPIFLLSLLGIISYSAHTKKIPPRLIHHPATFVFALSALLSGWALFGAVGFAHQHGYSYFSHYYGISGMFIIAPAFLIPLYRLTHNYQLGTLADLLVFRYRSSLIGKMTAIISLTASIPLLASQITSVNEIFNLFSAQKNSNNLFACLFTLGITLIGIGFSFLTPTQQKESNASLILCAATIGLIKMICIAAICLYLYFFILNHEESLQQWLAQTPQALEMLYAPLTQNNWRTLIFVSFASVIAMPHVYHMIFSQHTQQRSLVQISWTLPLLILIAAFLPPFALWSALKMKIFANPDYMLAHIALSKQSHLLTLLILLASLSATGAICTVAATNLSHMLTNYLALPVIWRRSKDEIIPKLPQINAFFLTLALGLSLIFHLFFNASLALTESLLLSLSLLIQFTPALVGVLFWKNATKYGFIAGILVGSGVWLVSLLLPLIIPEGSLPFDLGSAVNTDNWQAPTMTAFIANSLVFVGISLCKSPSEQERYAAEACMSTHIKKPTRATLAVNNVSGFIRQLSITIGMESAKNEVYHALKELDLTPEETRPYNLRRLKDQIEINLSSILGPIMAGNIIERNLGAGIQHDETQPAEDIYFIESHIEKFSLKLTGLAQALDQLRRFHRNVLQDLPIGVCIVSVDYEIIGWNKAMEKITQLKGDSVIGASLSTIGSPWSELLLQFTQNQEKHIQLSIEIHHKQIWLGLYKSTTAKITDQIKENYTTILVEDYTEIKALQSQLAHSDRLASVGRFAVGIAHEVGNPVTGIACLAQEMKELSQEPETQAQAQQILSLTQRITQIIRSLMSYSHTGKTDYLFQATSLNALIENACQIIQLNPKAKTIRFQLTLDDKIKVYCDEQKLTQVLINLLANAIDASFEPGSILIETQEQDHSEWILISIEDHGTGIPDHIRTRIFDPFITTKEPGKGTGLGLSLVYNIVKDHGGFITIQSPPLDYATGTQVAIYLPKCYENGNVLPG